MIPHTPQDPKLNADKYPRVNPHRRTLNHSETSRRNSTSLNHGAPIPPPTPHPATLTNARSSRVSQCPFQHGRVRENRNQNGMLWRVISCRSGGLEEDAACLPEIRNRIHKVRCRGPKCVDRGGRQAALNVAATSTSRLLYRMHFDTFSIR